MPHRATRAMRPGNPAVCANRRSFCIRPCNVSSKEDRRTGMSAFRSADPAAVSRQRGGRTPPRDRAPAQATSVAAPPLPGSRFRRMPYLSATWSRPSTSQGKRTRRHGFHPLRCAKWYQATFVEDSIMLRYEIIFLIIAIIAAVLGFSGVAGAAGSIAYILAIIFVILFVASLIFGRRAGL